MIPGEVIAADGELELNAGRETVRVTVANTGDRPVQVGSHYHFGEANSALEFDRDAARGMRLDIAAGLADYGLAAMEAHYPNEISEENATFAFIPLPMDFLEAFKKMNPKDDNS